MENRIIHFSGNNLQDLSKALYKVNEDILKTLVEENDIEGTMSLLKQNCAFTAKVLGSIYMKVGKRGIQEIEDHYKLAMDSILNDTKQIAIELSEKGG